MTTEGGVGSACPTPASLAAFAVGDLCSGDWESVDRHLGTCEPCRRRLAGHDRRDDALVAAVVDSVRGERSGVVPRAWIDRARAIASTLPGDVLDATDAGAHLAAQVAEHGQHRFEDLLLEELIGVGSFGYVFRARDLSSGRAAAVKVGRSRRDGGVERERFLREARSIERLDHRGIVSLYRFGESRDGVGYIVTELIEGRTLKHELARRQFQAREAAALIAEIAESVHYAHEHGVVHRDLKPSNVLIDRDGRSHVTDFGLAKQDAAEATVTRVGDVMGTPLYMSPEQAGGYAHEVDARTDIYSLGVMLYELLVGAPPFRGDGRLLLLQVLEDEPRPPRRVDERVPPELDTICMVALQKDRTRRHSSARAMAEDLRRFLAGEPIQSRRPGPAAKLRGWCRQNPIAASLFGGLVLVAALAVGQLSRLSGRLVRSSALESAGQYADLLEIVNDLYSTEVVARVDGHGVSAAADYAARAGAIPLPATLMRVLLETVSAGESGMRGRQYSAYPFRFRSDGGPHDAFEREALEVLSRDASRPFYRFGADVSGRPVLRYARARQMSESCVGCHNHHPESAKRDWQVGDVRGVLEIIRPLDQDQARARRGLRGAVALVVAIGIALAGLAATLTWGLSRGRRRWPRAGLESRATSEVDP